MTYIGKVHNGTVVLPPDAALPEGAAVAVEPLLPAGPRETRVRAVREIAAKLTNLPADLAKNHDHYLAGTPRK